MLGETLRLFLFSLSLGALVGLVRQWADRSEIGEDGAAESSAGLRTYALWSFLGTLSVYCSVQFHSWTFPIVLTLFGSYLIVGYAVEHTGKAGIGLTSYAAGLITFLMGAMVMWGELRVAVAIAAALGVLIAVKQSTHAFTRHIRPEDVRIALQFLVVTGLILPIVPNAGMGPADAINPYKIWWMVVLISGLGFAGYLGIRVLGANAGILMTGVAGGFASSTATTLALSRASRQMPELSTSLGLGILLACTIMFARVWAILLTLHSELAFLLILPFCLMAAPGVVTLLVVWIRGWDQGKIDTPELKNPLSLGVAIKFALLYAVIVLLVTLSREWSADKGLYLVSFLSGLTDMDAIALSLTDMVKQETVGLELAAKGIVIGAIANTLFKAGFAIYAGSKALRGVVFVGMGSMVLAGVAGWWML